MAARRRMLRFIADEYLAELEDEYFADIVNDEYASRRRQNRPHRGFGGAQHNFKLLDEVFHQFLETNMYRGRHWDVLELLAYSALSKRFFKFEHLAIPYLATLVMRDGHDASWLNIKLCNDSFVYEEKRTQDKHYFWHESQGWQSLPKEQCLDHLSRLQAFATGRYEKFVTHYNALECRLDIQLFPISGVAGVPHLLITFENGYPFHQPLPTPIRVY
jgi:hypothetical protein